MDAPVAPRQRRLLMLGWLAPPLIWLGQLQLAYALTGTTCASGKAWPLLAVTAAAAVATTAAGSLVLRAWWTTRAGWPGRSDDAPTRESFAAAIGVLVTIQVLLILIAQVLAIAIVGPCG